LEVQLYTFFNLGAMYGWVVNATSRPLYPRETDTLPIVQEAGLASGSVWMATEKTPILAFEPGIAQPVTISYADYAIPLHKSSVS